MRQFLNNLWVRILQHIPYVQKLESDLKKALCGELSILSMHIEDGKLNATFKTKIQMVLAEWAFAILNDFPDAENYIEIGFMDQQNPDFAGTIRIQKHSGKSPHELRLEAEANLAAMTQERNIALNDLKKSWKDCDALEYRISDLETELDKRGDRVEIPTFEVMG